MSSAAKWAEISQKILGRLDIAEEYKKLGVDITGKKPSASGWLSCWAIGRPHGNNPSAAINVSDGPLRGRYRDLGGSGESLSFWDFAARYGTTGDWSESRRFYARQVGLGRNLPKDREERPEESIGFQGHVPTFALMVKPLVTKFPGITADALELCGAQIATYPKKSQQPRYCVVLPAYGPNLFDGGPRGYCLMATDGGPIMLYKGEGRPPEPVKRLTKGTTGLVGKHGLEHLDTAEVIWKVEGITDLLALQALIPPPMRDKHVVITNLCGAHETWLPGEVATLFAGKNVCLLHDCDEPGQNGAKLWTNSLLGVAASVRNVILPYDIDPSHGQDLRDWIAEGHTYTDLFQLAKTTEPTKTEDAIVASLTPHQAILRQLGIMVLGELEGTKTIITFSARHNKMCEVKAIDKYKLENAIQDFGEEIEEHLVSSPEPVPGKVRMPELRKAIAAEGGKRRITDRHQLGIGVWELNNRLLLVGAGEVLVLNGHLERSTVPALEGKLLDFGGSEPWYDFDTLTRQLELAKDPQWSRDVLSEAISLFRRWDNWRHRYSPELVAALVCATWIQSIWDWRPMVSVTGPTASGKSMLLEVALPGMFGPMSLFATKPTEAGIRQEMKHSSRALIIDEFEHDIHRQKILELFRTSSRGGKVFRGTSSQRGTSYGLRHIPWVGAIETGLKRAADRNRFIFLDLEKVKRAPGEARLQVPDTATLADLGMRLLVVAMRHWQSALSLSRDIAKQEIAGIDRRILESYSVPCAILGSVLGHSTDAAVEMLLKVVEDRELGHHVESDEERLLATIFESPILLSRGQRSTVSELLSPTCMEQDGDAYLRHAGIKRVDARSGEPERIFFVHSSIKRQLLRDNDFGQMNIEEILLRVEGARKCKQRMGSHLPWGVAIPLSSIESLLGKESPQESQSEDIF